MNLVNRAYLQHQATFLEEKLHRMSKRRTRWCRRLNSSIQDGLYYLQIALKKVPDLPNIGDWENYHHSFELLLDQFKSLSKQLNKPFIPGCFPSRPGRSALDVDWKDYCEDLEELADEWSRSIAINKREKLLAVLSVLDTTFRLEELRWPSEAAENETYHLAFASLREANQKARASLEAALHHCGASRIPLAQGDYPPAETTRILHRIDNGQGENIAITQIVEPGYVWQGCLLRKALVVVVAREKFSTRMQLEGI